MDFLSGKNLADTLRNACDSAKRRFWIASPYIGGWSEVRRIIGRNWWDKPKMDTRLLTDPDEGGLNGATVLRLAQRGAVHQLRGLHAKLYIIDDSVFLTSANLTGTAFSKRYEAGICLYGPPALVAIKIYEDWWDFHSEALAPESLAHIARNRRNDVGEDDGDALTILNSLPDDPGDFGGHKSVDIFLDYVPFLKDYRVLTREYVSVQRIWPKVPIYFEIDGFLDYLFRHHPKRPTKRFEKDPPRNLSKADRTREIRALAKQFKDWADREKKDGRSSVSHSRLVRRLLSRRNIKVLTRAQIREVVAGLNCMNDPRQRARFLKSSQNSTAAIRTSWEGLLFGTQPDTERMSLCANRLFSFKRSSVQTRS